MRERLILSLTLFLGMSQLSWTIFAMDEDDYIVEDEGDDEEYSEDGYDEYQDDDSQDEDSEDDTDMDNETVEQFPNQTQMTNNSVIPSPFQNAMNIQNNTTPMQMSMQNNKLVTSRGVMQVPLMQFPMQAISVVPVQSNGLMTSPRVIQNTTMSQQPNIMLQNRGMMGSSLMPNTLIIQQPNIKFRNGGSTTNNKTMMQRSQTIPNRGF